MKVKYGGQNEEGWKEKNSCIPHPFILFLHHSYLLALYTEALQLGGAWHHTVEKKLV